MKEQPKHWIFILTHTPTGNFFVGTTAHPNVQSAAIKKLLEAGKYSDIRLQKVYKSWDEMTFEVTMANTEAEAIVEKDNIVLSFKDDEKCLNHVPVPKGGSVPADHPHFNQYMNKFEGISCVYVLKNKRTKHFYIGSSVSVSNRTKTHLRELRDGEHHCYKLQKDYTGLSDIEFGIFPAGTEADARELEQKMLDMFHGKEGCLNSSNSAYSNFKEVPQKWKHRYYKGHMRDPKAKLKPRPPAKRTFVAQKSPYGLRPDTQSFIKPRSILS